MHAISEHAKQFPMVTSAVKKIKQSDVMETRGYYSIVLLWNSLTSNCMCFLLPTGL